MINELNQIQHQRRFGHYHQIREVAHGHGVVID